ncbi:MAG: voltage-gated potassium channel [Granulosicoccus sp.]|jgi:voltage-gated potassium channel
MSDDTKKKEYNPTREKIFEIIFEADTPIGKWFDIFLIIAIIASVLIVMLESVDSVNDRFGQFFRILEWMFTILFTLEYILRLYVVHRPWKYTLSFFGIVDLLSILPSYLSFFFVGSHSLMVIRAIRLLRVFRIFKLVNYSKDAQQITSALKSSRRKIFVFLTFIMLLVIIFGSVMYLIEGNQQGSPFDSIPRSIYWAIVTLTTVGYGDISPTTSFGQFLAAIVMLLGYAVIAVPTGIVSSEMTKQNTKGKKKKKNGKKTEEPQKLNTQVCSECLFDDHADDAYFCKKCGTPLHFHDHH